jgi:hypothetical protein
MSFWEKCASPDSILNDLDSRQPRQRRQIFLALEDKSTCGEWIDPGHRAFLYNEWQGVVVYVHDEVMRVLLCEFFSRPRRKKLLEELKEGLR